MSVFFRSWVQSYKTAHSAPTSEASHQSRLLPVLWLTVSQRFQWPLLGVNEFARGSPTSKRNISLLDHWFIVKGYDSGAASWDMGKAGNLHQAPLSQHLQAFTNSRSSLNSVIGSGRSPGGGHGNSLQCSCLENPMGRGGLQSVGLQRVEHYWSDVAHTHPWRLHHVGIVDQIIDNWQLICPLAILSFPAGSEIKYLPAMQETWVQSLSQEDPLEKGMATHSSILV